MSIEIRPLNRNTHYMFQLISAKDGTKTKAFAATPAELCEIEGAKDEEFCKDTYVNFIMDLEQCADLKADIPEDVGATALILQVPIYSFKTFVKMFGETDNEEELPTT